MWPTVPGQVWLAPGVCGVGKKWPVARSSMGSKRTYIYSWSWNACPGPLSSPRSPPNRGWPWKHCWTNLWISSSMAIKLLQIPDPTLILRLETPEFRVCWYPQGNLFKVQNSWDSDQEVPALSLRIGFNTRRQTFPPLFFVLTNKLYILHCNPGMYLKQKFHKLCFPLVRYFLLCSIPFFQKHCWSN